MTQQRKHTRIDFQSEVTLLLKTQQQTGLTINISQGGALIQTSPSPGFGEKLTMEIQLPKIHETCKIPCIVRWLRDNNVGVQFETLRAIEVWSINQLTNPAN